MKRTVTLLILLMLLSMNTYAITGKHQRTFIGHTAAVNSVAFSPDGTTLASTGEDGTVQLWDTKTTGHKWLLIKHRDVVSCVIFSPDSTTLVSGSWDGTVQMWEAKTGKHKGTLIALGHAKRVFSVAFSPDGKTLACAGEGGTVWLWEVKTGMPKGRLIRRTSVGVYSLAFSPDGSILASGSRDKTVQLWDPVTGEVKSTLVGHTGEITMVAFSPDGRILASGGRTIIIRNSFMEKSTRGPKDNTVRLWNPVTGELISTLEGHEGAVSSVAFSPDGTMLASGSRDRTMRLWKITD